MKLDDYKLVSTAAKDLGCSTQWIYTLIHNKKLNTQLIDTITYVIIDGVYKSYKKWRK